MKQRNFQYINTIYKPNGRLRDWKEHNILAKYEYNCNTVQNESYNFPCKEALDIKDKECKNKVYIK